MFPEHEKVDVWMYGCVDDTSRLWKTIEHCKKARKCYKVS